MYQPAGLLSLTHIHGALTCAGADQREIAMSPARSKWPTNKWCATQVTGTAALLTGWVTAGEWNKTLSTTMIGLVAQAIVSYVLPNAESPGGVPAKKAGPARVRVTA